MVKTFLQKRLFWALFIASLIYTLPAYNKYWAPCDEGIILVAAERLLSGEVPYRDFFIIMYPPGQIFVLGFLLKIFSSSIIAGRIYTCLLSVGISIFTFYMALLFTRRKSISFAAWFLALVSLAPRLGPIPAPIWPGVFLGVLTLYLYMKRGDGLRPLVFTGIAAGLTVLFRHEIGIFVCASVFVSLFAEFCYRKDIRKIAVFALSAILVILPFILYIIRHSAVKDAIDSLVLFPFIHAKTASLPFPAPCFNLNMIFHGSLHFIKVNQYYIPLLVYAYMSLYLAIEFFKKNFHTKENLSLLAVLIFGVLTFSQVAVRTDPAHLLTVIQPSIVLFAFLAERTISRKFSVKPGILLRYAGCALIFPLFLLLSVKNIDKYVKNCYRKVLQKKTVKTVFEKGTIYIPREEREAVLDTVDYIKRNTKKREKIFVGNIAHWKDDFGGTIIMYYLADRQPSAKYYEFAPGLITNPDVQKEITASLIKHNVKLLVLQDIDLGGLSKRSAEKNQLILDNFIEDNFKFERKFGKYNIYGK